MPYAKEKNAAAQARWREKRNALAKRTEELEAENARLRAEVARLKARIAELEQAKPSPAPKPSMPSPAEQLKEAKKRVGWMSDREVQECIKLAKAAVAAAHPDIPGAGRSNEAAAKAIAELEFWRGVPKRRKDRREREEREKAERSARSRAAWAKRRTQQG